MAEHPTSPHDLPYPHLLTHETRSMLLVYTPAAEADALAQGYIVVSLDTRQIASLFRSTMPLKVYYG